MILFTILLALIISILFLIFTNKKDLYFPDVDIYKRDDKIAYGDESGFIEPPNNLGDDSAYPPFDGR